MNGEFVKAGGRLPMVGLAFGSKLTQAFLIGCRMTVFHFSGGTFLASDI